MCVPVWCVCTVCTGVVCARVCVHVYVHVWCVHVCACAHVCMCVHVCGCVWCVRGILCRSKHYTHSSRIWAHSGGPVRLRLLLLGSSSAALRYIYGTMAQKTCCSRVSPGARVGGGAE